jgi:TRAP-type C4-dicarboxylate transport system substrate-binding protein
MEMAMTRTWILGLLATTAGVVGGCLGGDDSNKAGGEQDPDAVVLTLASHESDTNDVGEFMREVARRSNGSLRIELKGGWRRGSANYEPQTIEDVREGKADLAKVGARAFDLAGVNSLRPVVAPLAVDSYALERKVLGSPLPTRMLRGVEQIDLVGIALLPGDLRKPLGLSRALVEASDYRGATIGTRASELGGRTFRALGGSSEYYEPGGDISSFDGTDLGLTGVEGDRLDGPARTLAANVNLWPRALAIVMNQDAYDALSDDQRQALHAAGRAAVDPAMDRVEAFDKEALGVLCNRREVALRSATPSQLDGLRAATGPLSEALERDPATMDAVREIAAMRADVVAEPAPTCVADERQQASAGATRVDGLWRMDSTESEYAEIASPGDVVPENWGEFTYAFADGRFAFTTENGEACLWAYGSYVVKGDVVEWTVEDGGGISVTEENFFNRPGEFYTFRWSRFRDRLTLAPVKGTISPEPYRVNPWRLLDERPARIGLARRCLPPRDALQP